MVSTAVTMNNCPCTTRHCTRVILLLVDVLLVTTTSKADSNHYSYHQVVPAARFEQYTFPNTNLLRTLDPRTFSIQYEGPSSNKEYVDKARQRFMKFLFVEPDVPTTDTTKEHPSNIVLMPLQNLLVKVTTNDTRLHQDMDESYSLILEESGDAILESTTVFGALRGLETFCQLIQFGWMTVSGSVFVVRHAPLLIQDEPQYPHRGLMIDTARHYLPLELILDTLDAMAMNKLNVLHWHMTDDQSFPYVSAAFPELSLQGSYGPTRVYTRENIRQLIHEAFLRGIRVIVEFDMPGHVGAIGISHPEWMSHCPDPSSPLNPTISEVYDFIQQLYNEVYQLFPDDLVHVGGDEVFLDCWTNDSSIQAWMYQHKMKNRTQLYGYFENKLLDIVSSFNKTMIVWQEVFDDLESTLSPKNLIIDVWKGYDEETIQQATNASYQVLVSGCWYLDHLDQSFLDFYQCNPRNFTGSLEQKKLVIGGHASMWGERVDASNFVSRVWPRASATAERLWSGSSGQAAEDSIMGRIQKFRCQMVGRGIMASPVGPGSCDVEPPYTRGETMALEKQLLRGMQNTS